MKEIYISWAKGLPQSKEALAILKKSGIISGVELSNIDGQVEMIQDAGLKVSSHTPGMALTMNLADPNYINAFQGEQGPRLLHVIQNSDAPTVGFHCGYSAETVIKMKAYPNIPDTNTLITDRSVLLNRITKNIISLEQTINSELQQKNQKQVVLETLDYSREKPISWELQSEEALQRREEIKNIVNEYGINAGIIHVTSPSFIKEVLDNSAHKNIKPIGFLFDVAHVLISADAKIYNGGFYGTINGYFKDMLNAINQRTYQLHLTVPEWNNEFGYIDTHHTFTPGNRVSDYVSELSREVVIQSPEISVVTLEMSMGLEPIEHAKEMIRQAEYVARNIL